MKLVKGLENGSHEEWLMELWLFSLEEAQREPHYSLQLYERSWGLVSFAISLVQGQEEMPLNSARRSSSYIFGKKKNLEE